MDAQTSDDDLRIDPDDDTSEPMGNDDAEGESQQQADDALASALAEDEAGAAEAQANANADAEQETAAATTPQATLEPHRKIKRVLLCKMHPEDLAKIAIRLSTAIREHTNREAEIKAEAKERRDELEGLWQDVLRFERVIHDGGEEREVECEILRDDKAGSMVTVRLDTGEVIDERAQDVEERQLPLTAAGTAPVPAEGAEKGPSGDHADTDPLRCVTVREDGRCEGAVTPGHDHCEACLTEAAEREEQKASAEAGPRCSVEGCEEEAGASGLCGQHAKPAKKGRKARAEAQGNQQ